MFGGRALRLRNLTRHGGGQAAKCWLYQSGSAPVRIQSRLARVKRARLPKQGTTRGATNGGHFQVCAFHLPNCGRCPAKIMVNPDQHPKRKKGWATSPLLPMPREVSLFRVFGGSGDRLFLFSCI